MFASALPLPSSLDRFLEHADPLLDDAEDILRGLVARCARGPIGQKEVGLIGTFLDACRTTKAQLEVLRREHEEGYEPKQEELPMSLRFVVRATRASRSTPWFEENLKAMHPTVIPPVVEAYDACVNWKKGSRQKERTAEESKAYWDT